jgi:hypothetical protein
VNYLTPTEGAESAHFDTFAIAQIVKGLAMPLSAPPKL